MSAQGKSLFQPKSLLVTWDLVEGNDYKQDIVRIASQQDIFWPKSKSFMEGLSFGQESNVPCDINNIQILDTTR